MEVDWSHASYAITQAITALAAIIGAINSLRNGRKIERIEISINGRMSDLIKQKGLASVAEGVEKERIREDIAPKVAADVAYQNAKENTPHTARMAHDQALGKVMQHLLKDDTQVYKQFVENESFRRFVGDLVYQLTNQEPRTGLTS